MRKPYNKEISVDKNNEVIVYNFKTGQYSSYLNDSLIANDVRTETNGTGEILPNGDLFIEETNYSRTLYFNADGSLRWTYVNRADDGKSTELVGQEFYTLMKIFKSQKTL